MTAYHCPSCGSSLQGQLASFEARQRIALHRQAHERTERRRAQWREAAQRKRRRSRIASGIIGYLHSLGCLNPDHRGDAKCRPIPVMSTPDVVVDIARNRRAAVLSKGMEVRR